MTPFVVTRGPHAGKRLSAVIAEQRAADKQRAFLHSMNEARAAYRARPAQPLEEPWIPFPWYRKFCEWLQSINP